MKKRGTYLIRAKVREMAADAIQGHIGQDRYELIKSRDQHPFFFGADVAHEGISTGEIMGQGNREKIWPAGAIMSLTRKINESAVPVFIGHSGSDRPSFGRMVSAFTENAKALAIGYIEDSEGKNQKVTERVLSGELNTVSIEADLILEVQDDHSLIVQQVEKVTGLALGDSRFDKPGFAGARVLAAVQEFEKEEETKNQKQKEKKMTLAEILTAIQEARYTPQQIFSNDQLLAAEPVVKALETERQATAEAKKQAEKLTGERDKAQKSAEEMGQKLVGYEAKSQVGERIKAAKLTEKEAKYTETQMVSFIPSGKTEEERQAAIDTEVKRHSATYKEYFAGSAKLPEAGKPAGDGKPESETAAPGDMTAAANNPAIPGSPAAWPT